MIYRCPTKWPFSSNTWISFTCRTWSLPATSKSTWTTCCWPIERRGPKLREMITRCSSLLRCMRKVKSTGTLWRDRFSLRNTLKKWLRGDQSCIIVLPSDSNPSTTSKESSTHCRNIASSRYFLEITNTTWETTTSSSSCAVRWRDPSKTSTVRRSVFWPTINARSTSRSGAIVTPRISNILHWTKSQAWDTSATTTSSRILTL